MAKSKPAEKPADAGAASQVPAQTPSIGRIVHYVLEDGPSAGQHRPAIIVRTWPFSIAQLVQLQVFLDQGNDNFRQGDDPPANTMWRSSVKHDEDFAHVPAFGTWHWPERV